MTTEKQTQEPAGPESARVDISEEARAAAESAAAAATTEPAADPAMAEQLHQAREEAARNHDQYLRALAEMENVRKRMARERQDLVKFGNENLLREILPVIDNLERAVDHAREDAGAGGLLQGVEMTLTQFQQALGRFGVTRIDALGKPFDPAFHEAMGQMETTELPAGTVAQVLQPGYQLNERLLRPTMVLVAKAPAADAADPAF